MKISLVNLGCKVNQCECDSLMASFQKLGHEVAEGFQYADKYILNTCAVTAEAERKSRQAISRILNKNKDADIIVIGCASENDPRQFCGKKGFPRAPFQKTFCLFC